MQTKTFLTDYELGRRDGYKGWRQIDPHVSSLDYERGYSDGNAEWWFDFQDPRLELGY